MLVRSEIRFTRVSDYAGGGGGFPTGLGVGVGSVVILPAHIF